MDLLALGASSWPALAAVLAIATTVISAGTITTILTQLTKLPFVPIYASKYPRVTAVGFAFLTALLATFLANVVVVVDWMTFLIFVGVTAVVSFKIYDVTKPIVLELKQAFDAKNNPQQ